MEMLRVGATEGKSLAETGGTVCKHQKCVPSFCARVIPVDTFRRWL